MVQLLVRTAENSLRQDVLGRFGICTSEALTNLVLHAKNCAPDAEMQIKLSETEIAVFLEVYDPEGADPFDLRKYATDLSEIDVMAEGGRGLGLIMACADHVAYGRVDNKYRLGLTFNKADKLG
ncbi:ATP-binding protein [Loktanella sp. D2R18]|nr:ATP-binding protein [Loktanella sp. D2R18]